MPPRPHVADLLAPCILVVSGWTAHRQPPLRPSHIFFEPQKIMKVFRRCLSHNTVFPYTSCFLDKLEFDFQKPLNIFKWNESTHNVSKFRKIWKFFEPSTLIFQRIVSPLEKKRFQIRLVFAWSVSLSTCVMFFFNLASNILANVWKQFPMEDIFVYNVQSDQAYEHLVFINVHNESYFPPKLRTRCLVSRGEKTNV